MRRTVSGLDMSALFGGSALVSTASPAPDIPAPDRETRARSEARFQIGIARRSPVPLRDRPIRRTSLRFLSLSQFELAELGFYAANCFRVRGFPSCWHPGSRVAATIAQFPSVRRFGTQRAFVVNGHENLQQECAMVRFAAMERPHEPFANSSATSQTAPRRGS